MVYDYSVNKYFPTIFFSVEIISERFSGWEFDSHSVVISALTKPESPDFSPSLSTPALSPQSNLHS